MSVLSEDALNLFRAAAKRIMIIGKFNSTPGIHIFSKSRSNLTAAHFFDTVQPVLGRELTPLDVWGRPITAYVPVVPTDNPKETQRIFSDHPLFSRDGRRGVYEGGKKILENWINALQICSKFEHPDFSDSLLTLSHAYLWAKKAGSDKGKLSTQLRESSIAPLVVDFLMCPASDEQTKKKVLLAKFASAECPQFRAKAADELFELKHCLQGHADKTFHELFSSKDIDKHEKLRLLSENGVNGIKTYRLGASSFGDFRSAFKEFYEAYSTVQAYTRSPELWSFVFRWFLSLNGDMGEESYTAEALKNTRNRNYLEQLQPQHGLTNKQQEAFNQRQDERRQRFNLSLAGTNLTEEQKATTIKIRDRQLDELCQDGKDQRNPNQAYTRDEVVTKAIAYALELAGLADADFLRFKKEQQQYRRETLLPIESLLSRVTGGGALSERIKDGELWLTTDGSRKQPLSTQRLTVLKAFVDKYSPSTEKPEDLRLEFAGFGEDEIFEKFRTLAEGDAKGFAAKLDEVKNDVAMGLGLTLRSTPIAIRQDLSRLDQAVLAATLDERESAFDQTEGVLAIGTDGKDPFVDVGDNPRLFRNGDFIGPVNLSDVKSGEKIITLSSGESPLKKSEWLECEIRGGAGSLNMSELNKTIPFKGLDSRTDRPSNTTPKSFQESIGKYEKFLENVNKNLYGESSEGKDVDILEARKAHLAFIQSKHFLNVPATESPLGKLQAGNVIGVLLDIISVFGALHGSGDSAKLALPDDASKLVDLIKRINLSLYYSLPGKAKDEDGNENDTEAMDGLSNWFSYHAQVCDKVKDDTVVEYFDNLRAVMKLIEWAKDSELEIVVVNQAFQETIDVAVPGFCCYVANPDEDYELGAGTAPARVAFVLGQADLTSLYSYLLVNNAGQMKALPNGRKEPWRLFVPLLVLSQSEPPFAWEKIDGINSKAEANIALAASYSAVQIKCGKIAKCDTNDLENLQKTLSLEKKPANNELWAPRLQEAIFRSPSLFEPLLDSALATLSGTYSAEKGMQLAIDLGALFAGTSWIDDLNAILTQGTPSFDFELWDSKAQKKGVAAKLTDTAFRVTKSGKVVAEMQIGNRLNSWIK